MLDPLGSFLDLCCLLSVHLRGAPDVTLAWTEASLKYHLPPIFSIQFGLWGPNLTILYYGQTAEKNIARIARAAVHKCLGKSSFNVCPVYCIFLQNVLLEKLKWSYL